MRKFFYKAKNKEGQLFSGKVEANTSLIAAKIIREKGLTVVEITPSRESLFSLFSSFRERVTLADLANFTRQLSTMITAGLPITDALIILRSQSSEGMRKIIAQILLDVEGGSSLSAALEKHPNVFSPIYISIVRAGETGGVLDKVLTRLSENLENEKEFRGKVGGALIYPAIIVVGMIIAASIMMIFVVPKLTSLYQDFGANLPLATRVLVAVSNFSVRFWPVVLASLIGIVWLIHFLGRTYTGRRKIDSLILKIPILGNLQKELIMTDFTRTLGILAGVGVSLLEGLEVVSGSVGNTIISDALRNSAKQVEKGFTLAYALAQQGDIFPPMLYQIISVGEETGKLDEVLAKVSRVFEVEAEQKVKALTSVIEPAVMIIMGIGVGFLAVAIIMPIYNLTSAIK